MEIWKPIPGYEERYEVSDFGNVRRVIAMGSGGRYPAKGAINPTRNYKGYLTLNLTNWNGKGKSFFLHQVVMMTFVGKCPDGMEIHHENEIKTDCRLENLSYCTHLDNVHHSRERYIASRPRGEANKSAIYTEADVREMRSLFASGVKTKEIASQFNAAYCTVYEIVTYRSWKHVAPESAS